MSKPEWGLKRVCPSCATRYYDMKKKQPVCPSCGTVYDPDTIMKTRRGRSSPEDKARKAAPARDIIEDVPLVEDSDDEDTVIEDADELGEEDVDDVVDVESDDDR